MIEFQISAPASISIFGEHSNNNLKTSIDLRTTLNFQELRLPSNIEIIFPQINLFHKIPLQEFLKFYNNCGNNMEVLHEQVKQFISSYSSDNQKIFLQIFYYMLVRIMYEEQGLIKKFRIYLSTKLMIHEKFFRTASLKVCLAACLLHWTHLQKGIQNTFHDINLEKVYIYASRCENIVSEFDTIDIMVCTYGSMIQYESNIERNIRKALNLPSIMILLVDTKQTQDLEAQKQRVRELMNMFPDLANSILNKIDNITNTAADTFEKMIDIYKNNELSNETKYNSFLQQDETLKSCTRMNQTLLRMLNVSYYQLDEICAMAQKHGCAGKYTDFDNGRYAYIWYPFEFRNINIVTFTNELKTRGFDVIRTNLLCTGVKIE